MLLDEILQSKRAEVEAAKRRLPLERLQARVAQHRSERSLREALTAAPRPALIAELKRKSPSKGMLRERFDPVSLAQTLEAAGAAALSILTDEPHFGGHLTFLRDARQFTSLPVLRKDFLLDPYQIYESAHHQADAILLIVRVLTPSSLGMCLQAAEGLGLEALVEVHEEEELAVALRAGARIIGINHRDLSTFRIDTSLTERLVRRIPAGTLIVAESGLQTAEDVRRMRDLGVHALLIGEALMIAPDPAAKIRELFAGLW